MFGKAHSEDEEVHRFALSVVKYINNFCKEASEKHDLNFSCYATPAESLCKTYAQALKKAFGEMFPPEPAKYTEEELYFLSRVVYLEAGPLCTERHNQLVASVVLNRMNHSAYPSTIYDVIYQRGQYACTGALPYTTPAQRTIDICIDILEYGSVCPSNVVYQSEFRQGNGIYESIYVSALGTTTYFCYG